MITRVEKSKKKPCFICGTREKTVDVRFKDKSFSGTLCVEHMYEKLEAEEEEKK